MQPRSERPNYGLGRPTRPTSHYDGFDGHERLHEFTEELMTLPEPECGVRALFDGMERMPDADLGCPGPLVHTLERMPGR